MQVRSYFFFFFFWGGGGGGGGGGVFFFFFFLGNAGRLNGRLEEYGIAFALRRLALKTDAAEVVRTYRQYAADARAFGITSTQLLGDALPAVDTA